MASVALVAPAGGASRRPACSLTGSRTVLATASAKIMKKRGTLRAGQTSYPVTRWFGCRYRTNRRFRLAIVGEPGIFETRVTQARLAGPFAAVADQYSEPAGSDDHASITVRDLRTGRRAFTTSILPDNTSVLITDLVLAPGGRLAWIEQLTQFGSGPGMTKTSYEVHAVGASGDQLLDSGPNIQPGSLARAGKIVYWIRGGQARMAQAL